VKEQRTETALAQTNKFDICLALKKTKKLANQEHLLVGLERYWHWVIGYWAIFADIG